MHDKLRPLSQFTTTCTIGVFCLPEIPVMSVTFRTVPTVPVGTGSGSLPMCAKITRAPGFNFNRSSTHNERSVVVVTLPRLFYYFGCFGGEVDFHLSVLAASGD